MDKKNLVFWNVDTQKDFMLSTGKLYIKGAEEIFGNLKKITEFAREHNIKVINTADYHSLISKELSEIPDFKTTFPPHCIAGTEGEEFIDETNPKIEKSYYIVGWKEEILNLPLLYKCRNIIIQKDVFDVFEGNSWTDNIIKLLTPTLVVVYGVATDVCVNFAVQGLLKRGIKVVIIKDAIKGLSEENCNKLLEKWKEKGVMLIDTDELESLIQK